MDFVAISKSVTINTVDLPKTHGIVKQNGNFHHFRNYGRILKNGKGLSFADMIEIRLKEAQKQMRKLLWQDGFSIQPLKNLLELND